MGRRTFICGVVTVLMLLVGGIENAEARTASVAPTTGLADGQRIQVTASPGGGSFVPSVLSPVENEGLSSRNVWRKRSDTVLLRLCGNPFAPDTSSPTDTVTSTCTVEKSFLNINGTDTIDCGLVPEDCLVSVLITVGQSLDHAHLLHFPISFGPATPRSTADCKTGGWRSLANDQGQPFRNQGQCMSSVAARK